MARTNKIWVVEWYTFSATKSVKVTEQKKSKAMALYLFIQETFKDQLHFLRMGKEPYTIMTPKEFLIEFPLELRFSEKRADIIRQAIVDANVNFPITFEELHEGDSIIFKCRCESTSYANAFWTLGKLVGEASAKYEKETGKSFWFY